MNHQVEPLVNFEVGSQGEEYEFVVDRGADRPSLVRGRDYSKEW